MNKERLWKRSLIYTQGRKTIEKELTYEFFAENLGHEFCFRYKDITIDICCGKENGKCIYELNINDAKKGVFHYIFDSSKELLENGRIDGKTIKEIWNELEN